MNTASKQEHKVHSAQYSARRSIKVVIVEGNGRGIRIGDSGIDRKRTNSVVTEGLVNKVDQLDVIKRILNYIKLDHYCCQGASQTHQKKMQTREGAP